MDKSRTFVIILAAGTATRLKPLSNRVPKPLILIKDKPMLWYIIESFKKSGFSKFCFLLGYKANIVKKFINKVSDIHSEIVYQRKRTGMADAFLLCLDHLTKFKSELNYVILSAADIIFKPDMINFVYDKIISRNAYALLTLMKSKDIRIANGHANVGLKTTCISQSDLINIAEIIEKPEQDQILSDFYSLPLYIFKPNFRKYLKEVGLSIRGEKELQDAIQYAIMDNNLVIGIDLFKREVTYEDIGKFHITYLKDILKINFKFLKEEQSSYPSGKHFNIIQPIFIDVSSKVGKLVSLGPNVILGKNCVIENNCVLKNVIVYDNVYIGEHNILNNCIIDRNVKLPKNSVIEDSFITLSGENNINIILPL